jgi:deazaflavin-dependent oxidoreductase (nitroreductase family)
MDITGPLIRAYLPLHQRIYEVTDGRLGHRLAGSPSLLLRSVGRRTGLPRTASLIYARDGEDYLVVASNHGLDRPPAWLLNIEAQPSVEIQVGRRRMPALAHVIEADDPGYPRRWAIANRGNHDRYTGYQTRTERPIPVVVLTPAAPGPATAASSRTGRPNG